MDSVARRAGARARIDTGLPHGCGRDARAEDSVELSPRADPELCEHLAHVPFNRARAEEQPRGDLWIRVAFARKLGDLTLLGGQFVAALCPAFADLLSRGYELSPSALGESVHAETREHVVRRTQLLAGIDAPACAAKPFPVEQVCARAFRRDAATGKPVDRLAIELIGRPALAQQGARASFDAQGPFGSSCLGSLRQAFQGGCRDSGLRATSRRLD